LSLSRRAHSPKEIILPQPRVYRDFERRAPSRLPSNPGT
jgi:hypothetical protein